MPGGVNFPPNGEISQHEIFFLSSLTGTHRFLCRMAFFPAKDSPGKLRRNTKLCRIVTIPAKKGIFPAAYDSPERAAQNVAMGGKLGVGERTKLETRLGVQESH